MPADDDIEAEPDPRRTARRRTRGDGRDAALRAVQVALIKEIDGAISRLERAALGRGDARAPRDPAQPAQGAGERLPRALRRASRHALLAHLGDVRRRGRLARRALDDVPRPPGRRHLQRRPGRHSWRSFIGDRRTLVIFGERATGKSTLLNSLFELVSVDDRFVAIERGPDLPALKERSFCVRLGVARRHRRPRPVRQGAAHGSRDGSSSVRSTASEVREFFGLLAEDPRVGGMATLRAGQREPGRRRDRRRLRRRRRLRARADRARAGRSFVHMRSDETGRPRLAAIWSIAGLVDGRARPGRSGHRRAAPPASSSPRPDARRAVLAPPASPALRRHPARLANVTSRRRRRPFTPSAAARYGLPAPARAGRVPVHVAARRLVTPAPASEAGAAKTTGGDRDQQV